VRNLLIVEDDPAMAAAMLASFEREGYHCVLAEDGVAAVARASEHDFDLVVLDVVLPRMGGFEVCDQLRRAHPRLGIIMVSARGGELNSVAGLRFGADDYVAKPFAFAELLARVDAVLRRLTPEQRRIPRVRFADVEVDFDQLIATRDGRRLDLTAQQLAVLRYLITHRHQLVTREEILRVASDASSVSARAADTIVWNLRRRLEDDPANPEHIVTVYGSGYRFVSEVEQT
jgi:two-component system alkaline phosphatase synthesis response regulator PhoP